MVLSSECDKVKYVQAPSRDKKYVSVAYARLVGEYCKEMGNEVVQKLVSALVEQAGGTTNGFTMASVGQADSE